MKHNQLTSPKRQLLATAIACAYMSVAVSPVYASDTEIYVDSTQKSTVAPNLMMMFDTSGSMDDCINSNENSNGTCVVSTDLNRISTLKLAMRQLLRGDNTVTPAVAAVPGFVKMGLSRYHSTTSKGGYVLYPVRPLDQFVGINPTGILTNTVPSNNSDAIQKITEVGSGTNTGGALKIGLDGTNDYLAALRFSDVRVPKGATITSAYLELTPNANSSSSNTWEIVAEAAGDAAVYGQINNRAYGAVFSYSPNAWVSGEPQTIAVTAAINEVVNRSDWCGGNALALRIRDVSAVKTLRSAYSSDTASSANLKPRLVINYSVNPEATSCIKNVTNNTVLAVTNSNNDVRWYSDNSGSLDTTSTTLDINYLQKNSKGAVTKRRYSGIRFQDVQIPKGAVINSATLKVHTANNSGSDYTSVQPVSIVGFKNPDINFCPATGCIADDVLNDATSYPLTTATQSWNPGTLSPSTWYGIDVKNIITEMVNLPAWDINKHLAFRLWNNGSTSKTTAIRTFNDALSYSARLEVTWTIAQLNSLTALETVRDQIEQEVNNLTLPSSTPLGSAYAEASRYMYGLAPFNTADGDYDPRTVASGTPLKYISPIPTDDECSASYIFLLTDGEPYGDSNTRSDVKGNTAGVTGTSCSSKNQSTQYESTNWDCIKALATYNNSVATNAGVPKKRIYTSTMILGPLASAITNMADVAILGGGKSYTATNTAALVNGLLKTVEDAIKVSGTISAAGVAVNQLNRLSHLDQLYYAVFEPRPNQYRWDGNLKRYKLSGDGSSILDAIDAPAIAADGVFKTTSQSFWGTTADGESAVLGGAANKLPSPDDRKMFTYMGALSEKNVDLTPINLTLTAFNDSAKIATGVSDNAIYMNLMNWYKGYEMESLYDGAVTPSTQRKKMGAALHSQPVLINYGYTGNLSTAATADNQDNYIFFSTLEGTLHAIEAKTGIEKFSFIPGEKLATLKAQYDNVASALPQFGMDLTWTVLRKDSNSSGQIGTGDKVYLYGGMRMGGSNYYAIDATDLTAPKLLFAIKGGVGGAEKFQNMGQTWSQPVVANVKINNVNTAVIIFGGGYDPRHEVANQIFTGNDIGNQLYIVDANTGALLWFASGNSADKANMDVTDMKFSVPSSPKPVDVNGDGVTDSIYFGDLGGQVFRVDLDNKAASGDKIAKRVRLLAKVGQTESSTIANQRRFYEPPAVATFKDSSGNKFATVAIGTGYRSRPLNVVTNERYFVLFDKDVVRPNLASIEDTALQATITTSTLAELDLNPVSVALSGADVTNKMGWYINFQESGEKSMATGLIFNSKLIFTSYSPNAGGGSSNCSSVAGQTNQYVVCMPYGKLCSTTPSYKTANVVVGLAGQPQLIVPPNNGDDNPSNDSPLKVLIGTKSTGGIFEASNASTLLQSTKKWREKVGN